MSLTLFGLVGQTMAHIHNGTLGNSGEVLITLPVGNFTDVLFPVSPMIAELLGRGAAYINIHTSANPGGEVLTV
jgi:hypothetical protein